jgi:hypothetical protein
VPYRPADHKGNRSNLTGKVNFDLQGFPIKLESRVDYDFTEKRLMHGALNVRVDYQCLLFTIELKVFSWLEKSYSQFRFGVSLGNLGMVGDFFGGK